MYLHYPTSFQISLKVFIQGDIVFHLVTWCYKFWEKVRGGGTKSVNKTKHNLNNVIERHLQNALPTTQLTTTPKHRAKTSKYLDKAFCFTSYF